MSHLRNFSPKQQSFFERVKEVTLELLFIGLRITKKFVGGVVCVRLAFLYTFLLYNSS